MATAKKAAPKKAAARKSAVKTAINKAVTAVRNNPALKDAISKAEGEGKLLLDDMIEHTNNHLKNRVMVTRNNIETLVDNLHKEIMEKVKQGEIIAEHKGNELLQYLKSKIKVPE